MAATARWRPAQAFEGCSPEPAGRPHEPVGNGRPRWMAATGDESRRPQNPAYRPTRPSPEVAHTEPVGVGQRRAGKMTWLYVPGDVRRGPKACCKPPTRSGTPSASSPRAFAIANAARIVFGCATAATSDRSPRVRVGAAPPPACGRSEIATHSPTRYRRAPTQRATPQRMGPGAHLAGFIAGARRTGRCAGSSGTRRGRPLPTSANGRGCGRRPRRWRQSRTVRRLFVPPRFR
jgi:hypothetical protein